MSCAQPPLQRYTGDPDAIRFQRRPREISRGEGAGLDPHPDAEPAQRLLQPTARLAYRLLGGATAIAGLAAVIDQALPANHQRVHRGIGGQGEEYLQRGVGIIGRIGLLRFGQQRIDPVRGGQAAGLVDLPAQHRSDCATQADLALLALITQQRTEIEQAVSMNAQPLVQP